MPHRVNSNVKNIRLAILCPAEFFHSPGRIPYLDHMSDFIAVEPHNVDVIALGPLTGRWGRATFAGMRAREHSVSTDVLPSIVGGKRLDLISCVGHERQKSLHPFRVLFQALHVSERLRLCGKSRIGCAIAFAHLPSFPFLARLEELHGCLRSILYFFINQIGALSAHSLLQPMKPAWFQKEHMEHIAPSSS